MIPDSVSVYKIGHTTYKVRRVFNLDCKETLEDVIKRLIIKDIDKLAALQV
ncbi:MAG: transposon-encoded TnpW family protein [Ruminiclostridium sp.]|nr:transposon-encoded TnpW family protein [Ruminiclostridium sp.]